MLILYSEVIFSSSCLHEHLHLPFILLPVYQPHHPPGSSFDPASLNIGSPSYLIITSFCRSKKKPRSTIWSGLIFISLTTILKNRLCSEDKHLCMAPREQPFRISYAQDLQTSFLFSHCHCCYSRAFVLILFLGLLIQRWSRGWWCLVHSIRTVIERCNVFCR